MLPMISCLGTASVMNTELDNGSNSGQDPSNDNSMDFNNGNSGLIPSKYSIVKSILRSFLSC